MRERFAYQMEVTMTDASVVLTVDEEKVEAIAQRILEAVKPYQGKEGFGSILAALEEMISFQMALVCSKCRRNIARKLRADLPAMVSHAQQIQHRAQQEFGEFHFH